MIPGCKWILRCGLLLCSLLILPTWANTLTIGAISDSPTDILAWDILKLALSKSAPEVTFRVVPKLHRGHWEDALQQGQLSVIWAGTTLRLEQELLPVRIPVLKGLYGYRLFIIRKQDQFRFSKIHSLHQLKQLVAGSATARGDALVLRANGLPLELAPDNDQLFVMLDRGEIDYFPRALHEPWSELRQLNGNGLSVEQNLLLVYPYPLYFFVSQDNQALHDQIKRGLEIAIEDGSFDKLFFSAAIIKEMLSKVNLEQRIALRLFNPYLHPKTPFYREGFWLSIGDLHGITSNTQKSFYRESLWLNYPTATYKYE